MNTAAQELIVVEDQPRRGAQLPTERKATTLVEALAAAAADPRMDVTKIERLYAMHKEMMAREAETAFNDAMAKAQAEIHPVATNAFNDHTKSGYAKLEQIDKAITPIHTRHGLSISYDTETKNEHDPVPQGFIRIIAWVRHSGGHKERYHLDLPPDDAGAKGNTNKTMVQAIGSTSAYGRRYLKMMVFNVSTYDDKDGNRSSNGKHLDEKVLTDHLSAIDAASEAQSLNRAFGLGWNAAEELKDKAAQARLIEHRDRRRAALKVKA